MKNFYSGDIVIKGAGTENKWAITYSEMFFVACLVKNVDDGDFRLIYRPFQNYLKDFFYKLTHIRITVK
jgi:hypothetical protein